MKLKSVLIVVDDPVNRELIDYSIKGYVDNEEKYNIINRDINIEETVDFCVKNKPDLLIIDYLHEESVMNGVDVVKQLLEIDSEIRVIIFTDVIKKEEVELLTMNAKISSQAFVSILVRPIQPGYLWEKLNELKKVPEKQAWDFNNIFMEGGCLNE